ncbi:KdsC family phosphatase [Cecembia rubra]|uniref:3-deoxy-D-manno-octulosonate 8-phosphate phosphatase KdsC n=1 Tax=Cecembia rubra TaxID=1485585 RepID=A0A2P8E6M0_9BACT|nr:HAD-IIIA family hydrolase [Cecembia rubra]PSL05121.1 3-deoxy-D-manno-octulosonate 8-phosphate phosphatase (KDO 8-P phosphatase) [Cecembia rubra]
MSNYLKGISQEIWDKAAKIKILITDVDGVLTDGGIIYDDRKIEFKRFHVKDGFIVQHLRKNGVLVGAITGRDSKVVENRCEELSFDFHYHGVRDKVKKLAEILEVLEVELDEVAYIGDDLLDLPLLKKVGFSVCPKDAMPYVAEHVDYISSLEGGKGVFREVGDIILEAKGLLEGIIFRYANQ